jgi:hypothetical protein
MPATPLTNQPPAIDLDAIEQSANAATKGPWGLYQFGGDTLIEIAADLEETGTGYSARRQICRLEDEPMDNDPTHREWTAEEDWAQVQADAAFIASMSPNVAKELIAEVRFLRSQMAAVRGLCDEQDKAARAFEVSTPAWIRAVRAVTESVDPDEIAAALRGEGFGADQVATMLSARVAPAQEA